ncbi:MAG: hypothetical protein HamCj_06450 [Candidatus Hamiltonella defensa (Ceratovacuna japonica)]|nr:hypothetical protein [Candidatus Hamiltonella defensa]
MPQIALYGKEIETKTECPACLSEKLSELQQAEAEQEKYRKRSKIKTLMDNLNLPERFFDVTLDNYESVNPDAARCLKLCNDYATHWPVCSGQVKQASILCFFQYNRCGSFGVHPPLY